jgi:hypothetical protein
MRRKVDRKWRARLAEHDARMRCVEAIVKSLAPAERKLFRKLDKLADAHRCTDARLEALSEKLDELADGQKATRAMLDAPIKNIDRFVCGQGGNGRGGQAGRRKA